MRPISGTKTSNLSAPGVPLSYRINGERASGGSCGCRHRPRHHREVAALRRRRGAVGRPVEPAVELHLPVRVLGASSGFQLKGSPSRAALSVCAPCGGPQPSGFVGRQRGRTPTGPNSVCSARRDADARRDVPLSPLFPGAGVGTGAPLHQRGRHEEEKGVRCARCVVGFGQAGRP